MNEAPDDVRYIVNDLNLLCNILADIAEQKDVVPSVRVVLSTCLERAIVSWRFETLYNLSLPLTSCDLRFSRILFTISRSLLLPPTLREIGSGPRSSSPPKTRS